MGHNTLQNNHTFTETDNLQQSTTIIQPLQENSSNVNYNSVNTDPSVMNDMNDNNIFPTFYTNDNYSDQQPSSNEDIISTTRSFPTIAFPCAPQYDHLPQSIENIPSPFNGLNMTTINPSQSEIFSFDISGFKIIVIPTFSQQDNTYLNYSSSNITGVTADNQFTQNQQ